MDKYKWDKDHYKLKKKGTYKEVLLGEHFDTELPFFIVECYDMHYDKDKDKRDVVAICKFAMKQSLLGIYSRKYFNIDKFANISTFLIFFILFLIWFYHYYLFKMETFWYFTFFRHVKIFWNFEMYVNFLNYVFLLLCLDQLIFDNFDITLHASVYFLFFNVNFLL